MIVRWSVASRIYFSPSGLALCPGRRLTSATLATFLAKWLMTAIFCWWPRLPPSRPPPPGPPANKLPCRGRATNFRHILCHLMEIYLLAPVADADNDDANGDCVLGHSSHFFPSPSPPSFYTYLHKLISARAKTTTERNETARRGRGRGVIPFWSLHA